MFSLCFSIFWPFVSFGRVHLECQLRDTKAERFELENWLWTENIVLILILRLLHIYHCELDWLILLLRTAAMVVDGFFGKLGMVTTSDHASVVSMNLFVALLCACILIGHLLEENRWMNESITALAIVSMCVYVYMHRCVFICTVDVGVCICVCEWIWIWWQGLCTGIVILLTTGGKSSHLLVFSEDLFFIYLLPPIIFNAG
jgi:hypothetical protein